MLDYLVNLVGRLGHWGYLVIFLGAMLESAAFLGLLIPGESLVLVAGFFAAQGLLDLGDLIVIVAIGAVLSAASYASIDRQYFRGRAHEVLQPKPQVRASACTWPSLLLQARRPRFAA